MNLNTAEQISCKKTEYFLNYTETSAAFYDPNVSTTE